MPVTPVYAVGVACAPLEPGHAGLAKRIEAAMAAAVLQCLEDGIPITDSVTIKAAMLAARAKLRREAGLSDD